MILSTIETFIDQLRIIRIFLSRPLVQQQIMASVTVLIVAWLLSIVLHRLIGQRLSTRYAQLRGVHYLYWPLVGLGLGWISAEFLLKSRLPILNLYNSLLNLLWVLLLYRLLVAILYTRLNQQKDSRRYHHWLLIPFFLFTVLTTLVRLIVGSIVTVQAIPIATIGTYTLTLGTIIGLALIIYATIIVSWILQDVLYQLVAPRLNGDASAIHSVSMIGRYGVIAIGILLGLRSLGLDLSSFAIIGGGLSVGIGFGLQQIVANFFAGIILLFEQALRPGDVIKIEGEVGIVERLNIRSTVVRTYDNVEVIVPNERFLTSQLVSYTKSDRTLRLSLPVGVGYDSEPEQIRELLLAAASSHAGVLADPTPSVQFKGFGDSSIDFELLVWIADPRNMQRVRSDLYFAIWKQFAAHDIEIPFPQRDLNLRRGWEGIVPPAASP